VAAPDKENERLLHFCKFEIKPKLSNQVETHTEATQVTKSLRKHGRK